MKQYWFTIFFTCILTFTVTVQAKEIPVQNEPKIKASIQTLEKSLSDKFTELGIPGLSAVLVYDQEIIWSKGFGKADLENNVVATPATVFRIGSLTKLFTATMMMKQRDEGNLQLDQSFETYLSLTVKNPFEDPRPVTFRQMVSHTSGFPAEGGNYWQTGKFPTRKELYSLIPEITLQFAPLSSMKYSNFGIAILGDVLAKFSKMTYREYVLKYILKPLSMANSFFDPATHSDKTIAIGYTRTATGQLKPIPSSPDLKAMSPAGQLYSSAEDMAKFMSLQFRTSAAGKSQVLGGSSIREMHEPVLLFNNWMNPSTVGSGIGIGWFIREIKGHKAIGHGGGVTGYTSDITLVPRLKIGLGLFTNVGMDPTSLNKKLLENIVPVIADVLKERALRPAIAIPEWKKFTGTYDFSGILKFKIKFHDKYMILVHPSDVTGKEGVFFPTEQENQFIMKGGVADGEKVEFVLISDDEVVSLKIVGIEAKKI